MKLTNKLRNFLFGSSSITVGHCFTTNGASVLLNLGRTRAGLTPRGARLIADQLRLWANHAEEHGAITTMKWIVVVKNEGEAEAVKWAFSAAEKVEDNLTGASQ